MKEELIGKIVDIKMKEGIYRGIVVKQGKYYQGRYCLIFIPVLKSCCKVYFSDKSTNKIIKVHNELML